jgi:tripartite ATP-independent transporter DctM subunit
MTELLVILLLLLFFSGAPLYTILLGATAIGALTLPREFSAEFGGPLLSTYGGNVREEAIVFATIPLFIYTGYVMAAAKTADRLVRFANALLGWMPGGLAIVTILACSIFTIFTGASGVTIVALGALVMPALVKQRYPERFSLGLVTGTGSVGLLFPPAIPLFVYGTVYGLQASALKDVDFATEAVKNFDSERFLFAGVVPGLVLVGCLSLVAIVCAIIWKVPRQKFDARELVRSFVIVLPELLLPAIVLVPLIKGWGNIAQLAAVVIVYMVLLELFLYRDIKLRTLWGISQESLALIGTLFLVIYTSSAFTNLLLTAEIPQDLVAWAREHVGSKYVFLFVLNLLLLVVGMMMDIFSAVIIVVPLIAPIAMYYGIDPYHLGVIFLLNLEIGYLTPPVGLNLFISSFKFQKPVVEVTRATLPFIGTMLVALVLVTYIPQLTWVPPPKRNSPLSALDSIVRDGWQQASSIAEVTLPDGTLLKKEACAALEAEDDREVCAGLFIDVTMCRQQGGDGVAECEAEALRDYVAATGKGGTDLAELTLPGGALLKKADCETIEDSLDQESCQTLFTDVADCRAEGGELGKECEDEALAEYVDDMGPTGLGAPDDEEEEDEE